MAYDPAAYERQRRNLQSNFANQAALNAYQRYLSDTQANRGISEIQDAAFGVKREVPRLTSAFGQRGLQGKGVKSGVYNRALTDYGTQRAKELGYAQQDLASAQRGYDLRGTQYASTYEQSLADLEAQKAAQIAADAAALLNLR